MRVLVVEDELDLAQAIARAYRAVGEIDWQEAIYRSDIGAKGLVNERS